MPLADLRNNELIIVRKQWHLHHQSTLSGQFLFPAAALSYCSQQWRIMTTEQQQRTLFISVPLCLWLLSCQYHSLMLSSDFSLTFLVAYLYPFLSLTTTLAHILVHTQAGTGGGMWGIKLFKLLAESVTINEHKTHKPPFTSVYL